jgi:hypothetical protein
MENKIEASGLGHRFGMRSIHAQSATHVSLTFVVLQL